MRKYLAALVLLPVLAACGGPEPMSVADLAEKIGCTGFEADSEVMGVREAGTCKLDGEDIYLHTFGDDQQQESIAELSRAGGGVWVVGDLWQVQTFSEAIAEEVSEATGGKVE